MEGDRLGRVVAQLWLRLQARGALERCKGRSRVAGAFVELAEPQEDLTQVAVWLALEDLGRQLIQLQCPLAVTRVVEGSGCFGEAAAEVEWMCVLEPTGDA